MKPTHPLTRALLASVLLCLSATSHGQGFDPAKVDWEKLSKIPMRDSFIKQFNKNCAVCHGEDLQGAAQGSPLVGVDLKNGDTVPEIANSIATGFPQQGMPAWSDTLNEDQIWIYSYEDSPVHFDLNATRIWKFRPNTSIDEQSNAVVKNWKSIGWFGSC